MAYEKLNLQNNDTFNAEHVAHIEDGIANSVKSPLAGKKIVCLGDTTLYSYMGASATEIAGQLTGANVYNVSFDYVSAAIPPSDYSYVSMVSIIDAIISKDLTELTSSEGLQPESLNMLAELIRDFSTVDAVLLHYGSWDFHSSFPLDGEDKTSVCGAFRYSIEKLIAAYPNIKIYISLPLFRVWEVDGSYEYPDTHLNQNGLKLIEFIEGIRKVAVEYNLPVIDGFYNMGINKLNFEQFKAGALQLTENGNKRFGELIAASLLGSNTSTNIQAVLAALPTWNGGSY